MNSRDPVTTLMMNPTQTNGVADHAAQAQAARKTEHAQIDQQDAADQQRQADVMSGFERRVHPRYRANRVGDAGTFEPNQKVH
jgi:hypothetical protein